MAAPLGTLLTKDFFLVLICKFESLSHFLRVLTRIFVVFYNVYLEKKLGVDQKNYNLLCFEQHSFMFNLHTCTQL